jgi:acetyl-CoA C-acetyltransferase
MPEAYIVAATRTASGRRNGRLALWHPARLGAAVLDEVVRRAGVDPAAVEDVIMGCVTTASEQAANVARNAVLMSGLPQSVPGVTVDRQCGSSQQALQFAAQAVMSGMQDLVIAAGVESMTRVPIGSSATFFTEHGIGQGPYPPELLDRLGAGQLSQFDGAEMLAAKYGFAKDDLDRYALETHRRASAAVNAGAFDAEILPLRVDPEDDASAIHATDEQVRHDATLASIASVRLLRPEGVLTAATSSPITDGASAVLVASAEAVRAHGLTPLARVHKALASGGDPVIMLEEPIPATAKVLAKAGLTIDQIDLFEVNEAFASVPLAWLKATGADATRLNVNGGAIALGHPLGASGTKLATTLIHALRARGLRYGLQTMCEAGGQANAMIIEAL